MTAVPSRATNWATTERPIGMLAAVHLAAGIAMTLLIIVWHPHEGDPLPFLPTAEKIVAGGMPYRDVPSEYPPLAVLNILIPRVLSGFSHPMYQTWFSVISIIFAVATFFIVWWIARQGWSVERPMDAAAIFVGLALTAVPLVVWRFDILPAFLSAVALAIWVAGRAGWTGFALGVGAMAKIYPIFLGPVFALAAIAERRYKQVVAIILGGAIAVGLILAFPVLVAGTKAFSYVFYQENRGVEVEALPGAIAMFAHTFFRQPATVQEGFGAWQITSPVLTTLAAPTFLFNIALLAITVLACAYSFRRDVRNTGLVQPQTLVTYLFATVMVVILINKVLSPQYLIWLLPFMALLSGRQSLLLLVILVITVFIYPLNFASLLVMRPNPVVALNLRNVLLLVLFLWVVWPRRPARAPDVPPNGEQSAALTSTSERSYVGEGAE
ncbi:MAG TPA: glycosyltransferase 87 family protein [Candidatus Limnocylindrales bacterium]